MYHGNAKKTLNVCICMSSENLQVTLEFEGSTLLIATARIQRGRRFHGRITRLVNSQVQRDPHR